MECLRMHGMRSLKKCTEWNVSKNTWNGIFKIARNGKYQKKSSEFLTPFKLKANLFKQPGTFAKHSTFYSSKY
jgi:hypothetical protein